MNPSSSTCHLSATAQTAVTDLHNCWSLSYWFNSLFMEWITYNIHNLRFCKPSCGAYRHGCVKCSTYVTCKFSSKALKGKVSKRDFKIIEHNEDYLLVIFNADYFSYPICWQKKKKDFQMEMRTFQFSIHFYLLLYFHILFYILKQEKN